MPAHWWRPFKDNPGHDEKAGETVVAKFKSKDDKRKYVIVSCDQQPSDDAKFLVDDDLDLD